MPAPRRAVLLSLLVALPVALLAACQTQPSPGAAMGDRAIGVGRNELGEECRVLRRRSPAASADTSQNFEIYCGEWEQPSAQIVSTLSPVPLDELAEHSAWRDRVDAFAFCEEPRPATILGDVASLGLDCAVRRGGWRYQAMVSRIGETAYLGESIPASAALLERTIGLLAGRTPAEEPRDRDRGTAAEVGNGLYSSGDLARYRALLHQAQYNNFQGDHAEAERLYRQALALQQERRAGGEAGLAFVLMHIALELSNQERFAEAEPTFAAAEEAVRYSLDPSEEVRLISYRAAHLANQRRSQRAMQMAQDATTRRRDLAGEMMAGRGTSRG